MSKKGDNIYKRKDGRWEGRYIKSRSTTGKPKYGYVYAKTYRETKEKLYHAVSNNNLKKESPPLANHVTLAHIAHEWLDISKCQIKESTYIKYRNMLNAYILPDLGEYQVKDITYISIEQLCKKLLVTGGIHGTGLSTKTVSDTVTILRAILRYASKKGFYISPYACSVTIRAFYGPRRPQFRFTAAALRSKTAAL